MKHFTPVLPAREAANNARNFVRENQDAFWAILKPLLPYILALHALDAVVMGLFVSDPNNSIQIGGIFVSYFTSMLMISWHRVVIHGADRYEPANPFKPKRHELAFIFVPLLVGAGMGIGSIISTIPLAAISKAAAITVGLLLLIFSVIVAFRVIFYLPGKAVNANMTLRKSWHMSKGYIWKLISAGFLSSWRVLLVYITYLVAAAILGGLIGNALFGAQGILFYLFFYIIMLPLYAYFTPLLSVLGVTVLSNYYQWAINNPRPA